MGDSSELGWTALVWIGLDWARQDWALGFRLRWTEQVSNRAWECSCDAGDEQVSAKCPYHSI